MSNRAMSRTVGSALVLCLIGSLAASGQSTTVQRKKSERAPLERTADALGMERSVRRDLTAINAIYFVAEGMLPDPGKASSKARAVFGMSYFIPAIRMDVTRNGARIIRVANGTTAWNETAPGVGDAAPDTTADDRLTQVWLTPHGALRAMVDARAKNPDAVRIAAHEGSTTFTIDFQGGPLEVTTNKEHRPDRLRWTHKGQAFEVQYTGYKDWELLDVFFPQRIVQRVDGKVVADLKIVEFRSNPYVVFPIPASLKQKST